jgi:hypothetical protein
MSIPRAPSGAGSAGRALWRSVLEAYELEEHELLLLRQAVGVADVCELLQRVVTEQGPLKDGKAHPAVVELRAQRIVLARLIVALRVPLGEEDASSNAAKHGPVRLQRRAARGVYALKRPAG